MQYIHDCPNCNNSSYSQDKSTKIFGNNKFYTDDTHLSSAYLFVRCPYCYVILDVEKTCIRRLKPPPAINKKKFGEKSINAFAKCINLNLMEYYKLLNKQELSQEQEITVRLHIMTLENDKRRDNHSTKSQVLYNENEVNNFIVLEKLLDKDLLISIEISRYLKNFDKALELLENYKEDRFYTDDYIKLEYQLLKEQNIYVKNYQYSDDTLARLKKVRR